MLPSHIGDAHHGYPFQLLLWPQSESVPRMKTINHPHGKLFGNTQMLQFEDGAYGHLMEVV